MKIKVSVVIPVYNVERTLSRCVDSIINQSLKEIEIILVDDGSPDNSGLICDNYAKNYTNIRVIHKENEGLGPTRNAGAAIAMGEYIYHCDSDDWIEPRTLEDVFINAKSNDAEAVIFGYRLLTEDKENIKEYGIISGKEEEYKGREGVRTFFIQNLQNSFFVQVAWNRLIKRDFLENNQIEFKPYRRCQDILFSLDLFDKLERINVLSSVYYNYIIEPGKFKGRSFEEMINIHFDVYEAYKHFIANWGMLDNNVEKLLKRKYISHVSNYSSFYIINKGENRKLEITKQLVNDKRIQELFNAIKSNDLESRFLRMVHYLVNRRYNVLLLLAFYLHQKKQGIKV